jgi:hypothetical protein
MAKHTFLIALLAAFPALAAGPAEHGIPLFFVANDGQTALEVRFMAKGSGLTAYFLKDEAVFQTFGSSLRMHLEGANPKVRIEGASPLAGRVNFFTGGEENWRAGLPMYGAVAYRDLYAGIDMVYGGSGRNLKSEFLVAAGADPSLIRVRYLGAGEVRIDADGALAISVNGETIRERAPEAYQIRRGKRVAVESHFQAGADGAFGFAVGAYDRSLPLVIDPVLSYSTLLGGSGADAANALAVDSTGAAYIAGFTASYNLPTLNPEQAANGGGNDAFVAKLNSTGNALVYCTYLGGTGEDKALGIAVDSTGAAYVTGWTQSANFPVRNALQASLAGGQNAFVVKLTPTGNGLAYSTFLGGNGSDSGNGIALDSSFNAYVVGDATSTNFPTSASGFQKTYHGGQDAFVAKLSSTGASLVYSTYIGGGNLDHGAAIAVDASGTTYITGSTSSTDFPMASAFQGANGGGQNAFITRLSAAGTSLLFSTFLGGSGGRTGYPEAGQGIALDSAGNAYIAGVTSSANFPVMNPAQSTLNGSSDAFMAKMSAAGALVYSTYLGGSGLDAGNAVAVDSSGNAYIGGYTYSIDLPVVSAVQSTIGSVGSTDAFVGKLSPAGNSVSFLTYLGGDDSDTATGIAVDSSGSVYVAGWTLSANFPVLNAYQTSNAGNYGAFVTKYVFNVGPVNVSVTPNSGSGAPPPFSFQYSDANGAADLTAVGALFNTSSSLTGACAVIYNRALNTLALLTDAGAQPAGTLTPGSGTQQNSQCVLSGGGSSVSLSGNLLTLNLAITFQGGFAGAKNIYMQSSNPFQITAWQAEGTWGVLPAIAMTATPASGNATQQTFNFQVSDSFGATDLASIGALFNTSTSTTSACSVTYSRAQNTLALLTDAGAQPAGTLTPGSGTQQNSQCVLNGAGSSVSVAGNLLTLNLALSFQPAFAGAKNVYMDAVSSYGALSWTQEGTWTSPPVVTMAVSPSSGAGTQQVFSFQATDSLAATDLTTIGVLFSSTTSTTGACSVLYNRALNTLALLTDAGAQPASSIAPGSGTEQNSQCVLSGSGSSVSVAGNTLTLSLQITFLPAFTGTKNTYMDAANAYETVNWQVEGTWVVASALTVSVTPSAGNGTQQTFNLQVSDPVGAADLTTVGLLFNSSVSTTAACAVLYNRAQNTLALLTDAGAQPAGSLSPGSGTQQNSQCVLNGSGSNVALSGNVLVLNLAVSFLPGFSGTKSVYAEAIGVSQTMSWQQEGIWTSPPVVTMAVTPSSGGGSQQKFVLQVTDSLAGTDLTTVGILINPAATTAAACAVIYNSVQNSLALLTDAGAQPASSIAPGSGSQQNSQCVLNGAGSSVSVAGNTLTLSLALTFQPAFLGQKNIYMDAANPYEIVNWQLEGTWVSAPVPAISVTPSAGIATQQTFSLQVTDALGVTDLSTIGILFNSSTSTAGACAVTYNRAQNALMLLTDAGAQPAGSIVPGSGSQQNSQCVLNGAGSSASASGNTLTLSVALGFQPAFSGTKNLYAESIGAYQTVNWQPQGTWTSPPVVTMAVTPSSGGGTQQKFTFQVTDSLAASDVTTVGALFNTTASVAGACAVIYNSAQNTLMLLTDAGAQPASAIAPGAGTQQNSQCVLSGSGSSVSALGNALTLNLTLTFQAAFTGVKNVYMDAANAYQTLTWQAEGTWATAAAPAMSVTPSSGSATQQTFSLQVSDPLGAVDLTTVGLLFNSTTSVASACAVTYNRAQNALMLLTDAGAAPASAITPGSGTQQNSQCVLNGAGSSASVSGNVLTLSIALSFQPAFSGTENLYAEAASTYQAANWQLEGTWISPPLVTMAVSPSSGGGTQQKFTLQVTDSLAETDLTTVGMLFNSTVSTVGACTVMYNRAQNTLMLLTDAGAAPATSITPGSGTQQNSQCVLSGSGASASASGNTLTLNLTLSFQPAFVGTKNVYIEAANSYQAATWQLQGTWNTAVTITMAAAPSSGSGPQQTFSFQFSDSAGVVDLTTAGALINATATTTSACAVIYTRLQNTFMLLTDSGGQPAGSITPGSGAQQNSQCILNGAGSTVSVSGNTLTLNLSISFQTAFDGVKNIYMDAVDPSTTGAWQLVGSWAATPVGPSVVSVTPASGSGSQQTFSLRYSDSAGATDLSTVWVWFTQSFSSPSANSCMLYYARATNQLFLLSDAATIWSPVVPGAAGTLSNSQCSINMGAASATGSGADLILSLPVTFTSAYAGNKSVFMYAASNGGTVSGWQQEGSWTVPQPPPPTLTAGPVTPSSGSGSQQAFSFQFSDSNGGSDLASVGMLFNATSTMPGGCAVIYNRAQNTLMLYTDAGAQPASSLTPGSGTQQNSQCTLTGTGSGASISGNVLTLILSLSFQAAFVGTKTLYMEAASSSVTLAWQAEGAWTVTQPPVAGPAVASVTPASGSGAQQTFALLYTDSVGATDLSTVWVWFTQSFSSTSANSCMLYYARATNQLFQLNDAGTVWSPAAPGTAVTLSNSQCSVNMSAASVAATGTNLILNLPMTFTSAFNGSKSIFMYAASVSGAVSGWQQEGSWTVPQPAVAPITGPVLLATSVAPLSGSGVQQTFALQYADSAGATDLSTVWVWFTSNFGPSTNTCMLYYARATNQLFFLNDAGTTWSSPVAPGTAITLSNSQCSVNVGAASVTATGTDLILNLPMIFSSAYEGSQSIYTYSASAGGAVSGWQPEGSWTVPQPLAPITGGAVTPAVGSGAQQTFALQYTDSVGEADLSTVWVWFTSKFNTATSANSCMLYYARATNQLFFLNDAGTTWSSPVAPGTAITLSNSQCSINVGAASVTASGVDLILNLPVTFTAAYDGSQGIYIYAASAGGTASGWQQAGSWTVPQPVVAAVASASVTPASGSGAQQTFALHYTDSAGTADFSTVWVWFTQSFNSATAANSCMLFYTRATNQWVQLNDAGTVWSSPVAPGTAVALSNSQCSIDMGAASVTASGTDLILNLPVTFITSDFNGNKSIFMYAASESGATSGWTSQGSWLVQ